MSFIDLNCDMGELPGSSGMELDAALMPYISSANIACGYHAGNENQMYHTAQLAVRHGVAIGAHPGLADKEGFGRIERAITPEEVYQLMLYQIGALGGIVRGLKSRMHHVKPHGALYHLASRDRGLADAIARAVADFDASLLLYGLPGSQLELAAAAKDLHFVREGFADRRYLDNGGLVPRGQENAMIRDPAEMIAQATSMAKQRKVDSLCVHGDGEEALMFVKTLYSALKKCNITIRSAGGTVS